MSRFLIWLAMGQAWFLAAAPWLRAECGAGQRPNIVLIMADDLGYGDISPYGGWIETPQLERLAAGGIRLTDYHSSGNVCSPTRAGLMTGRYQQRAGLPRVVAADPSLAVHAHGLQAEEITIAERLSEAGYATAIYGKWHLGYEPQYNPIQHGFGEFRGYVSGNIDFFSHYDQAGNFDWWIGGTRQDEPGYVTHLIEKHAIDFVARHADQPFFLYLPHEAPHYPFQGPDDFGRRRAGVGLPADWRRTEDYSAEKLRERYRQMVIELDRSVGRVLDTLETHGILDNTLVFFCSDNGAAGSFGDNTPLRGAKGSDWEGGHRVPAIVQWPGKIQPGSESDELMISLDIFPTALAIAGLEPSAQRPLDGVDLLPVLCHGHSLGQRRLFWNGKAMREGPWKLMLDGRGSSGTELYHLGNDIGEQHDLAWHYPQRVANMLQALHEWDDAMQRTATAQPGPAE